MMYTDQDVGKDKVLIVDDVEINRIILEGIIKDMGGTPVLAENGEEALEKISEECPDLVLTDISMPGLDGYELCRILKKDEVTKNTPVIFISAFDDPQDIVEGFLLGGEDYITKPFIPEVVQARVGVHLRLHRARYELMEMNRKLQASVNEQLGQLELEKKNILYALAGVAAKNASYDETYMERLKTNCRTLAQGMQLSPLFEEKISDTFIDTVELAAPLCDIGNIGVPRDILLKQTEPTGEEVEIQHDHTTMGAEILGDLYGSSDYNDFIRISTEITHYHHENWDGSGYPDGLKGEEIPLAAQIVSLMDRYCGLTGDKKMSREEALSVMQKESCVKFNPDIFNICCKISRQFC